MKRIIFSVLSVLFSSGLYSQDQTFNFPEILPPETAEMMKYIDHPVDLNHGLASVEIPLYVIKEGSIEIPLSIKYHASGLKIHETSNKIGLGWNLDFGPSLSRRVNCRQDENGYLINTGHPQKISNESDFAVRLFPYLTYLAGGEKDEYPDTFYYKLLSKSGKFMFDRGTADNYSKEPTIVTIPYEPIKITHGGLHYFDIWDDGGFRYRFGCSLKDSSISAHSTTSHATSSWNIQEVVSPDRMDTISFGYHTNRHVVYTHMLADYISIEDVYQNEGSWGSPIGIYPTISDLRFPFMTQRIGDNNNRTLIYNILHNGDTDEVYLSPVKYYDSLHPEPSSISETKEQALRYIESKNVRIEILYDNPSYSPNPDGYRYDNIKRITVLDITNENATKIIRTIEFIHSYFGYNRGGYYPKSKLDEIKIYGENNQLDQTYSFTYHDPKQVPNVDCRESDHWGYWNGNYLSSEQCAVPKQEISCKYFGTGFYFRFLNLSIGDADKSPTNASQVGLLKSITYPTGRKSTFHYEQNQHRTKDGVVRPTGGNRIRMIAEYEPLSNTIVNRTFKYGINEDGAGKIKHDVSEDDYMIQYYNMGSCHSGYWQVGNVTKIRLYSSTPFTNLFYQNGAIVSYEHVAEYIDGKGKIEYVYSPIEDYSYRYSGTTMFFDNKKADWSGGELLQKTEYKFSPDDNDYYIVKKEDNQYEVFEGKSVPYGMCYQRMYLRCSDVPYPFLYKYYNDFQYDDCPDNYGLPYMNYYITSGCTRLKSQTIKTFDGSKSSSRYIVNSYGNKKHLYLTSQTISANGNDRKIQYKYPQDIVFSNGSSDETARLGLIDNNILSAILQQEMTIGAKKWIYKTTYAYQDANDIPKAVAFSEGSNLNNLRTRREVEKFDKMSNPVYVTDKGKHIVYIWNGSRQLLAEIQNATYDEVKTLLRQNGTDLIDQMLESRTLESSNSHALDALRNQLPNALVVTLEYDSSYGINCITDPSGKKTHYNYDHAGRLSSVIDDKNNIIEEYMYNYKN